MMLTYSVAEWITTHCKFEPSSAWWRRIASCYYLVTTCSLDHPVDIGLTSSYRQRIKLDKMAKTDSLEEGVEVSAEAWKFVLFQLISGPICKDTSCTISRATFWLMNRHHPRNLNPYRYPRPKVTPKLPLWAAWIQGDNFLKDTGYIYWQISTFTWPNDICGFGAMSKEGLILFDVIHCVSHWRFELHVLTLLQIQ